MTDQMRMLIEPPKIETLFRRLIDGMGYHDAESIPTAEVFKMFKAFFNHEHNWNAQLSKQLADWDATQLKPILASLDAPPKAGRPQAVSAMVGPGGPIQSVYLASEADAYMDAQDFDAMRLISALSCIRGSLQIGKAVTEIQDALVIPAEVIAAFQGGWIECKDGVGLIAAERARQMSVEGWTPEHDDRHNLSELTRGAISYAIAAQNLRSGWSAERVSENLLEEEDWPWDAEWLKVSPDPVRNLVKAGALLAAEIDRLNRLPTPPEAEGR